MDRPGGHWRDRPERLGDDRTVERRDDDWIARGVLDQMLADLAREADLEEFITELQPFATEVRMPVGRMRCIGFSWQRSIPGIFRLDQTVYLEQPQ